MSKKLTKLEPSISNMGDKRHNTVADKKRKFLAWCEEQGILGLDIVSDNSQIDYDQMQRLITEAIFDNEHWQRAIQEATDDLSRQI